MVFLITTDTRRLKSDLVQITFVLSYKDAEVFKRPVNGIGGMQSLLRELQKQMEQRDNDTMLMLSKDQIKRIKQYATKYGESGGFQQRFQGILNSLEELRI